MAAVMMPALDRPSERAVQIRQAARKAFVEAWTTRPCDVPWWQDRVPGESSRLEIKLRSGRKGKGRGMRFGHARWHGRAIVLALCPGYQRMCGSLTGTNCSRCQRNSCRWQQSLSELQMMYIHQELRAIGENRAADGRVLPQCLDISRDPLPPSVDESTQTSPEERAERRTKDKTCKRHHRYMRHKRNILDKNQ